MTTTAEKIKIMQAFLDGGILECLNIKDKCPTWKAFLSGWEPMWNWSEFDYRIQPKQYWINIYKGTSGQHYIGRTHATRKEADEAEGSEERVACLSFREGDGL